MRFLIDECLHTSLVDVARRHGHEAHHVNWLGLGGATDRGLMPRIVEDPFAHEFISVPRVASMPSLRVAAAHEAKTAQLRSDEPRAAPRPQPGEEGPDSPTARGQAAPVPRVHPTSTPPSQAEMRVRPEAARGDPIVRDNLGDPVPITAAEVDAIETYLGPKLRDLLASAASRRKDEH